MMRKNRRLLFFLVIFFILAFVLAFSQTQTPQKPSKVEKPKEPTAFEKRCSVCHSLERVRVDMEKMIKEMHKKAGVSISDSSIQEIEQTFTLKPVEESHKALFQEKCSSCHSLDRVVNAHQTGDEAEMKKIIERMAEKEKSGISKEEKEKIHQSMKMLNEIYEEEIEAKPEPKK